LLDGGERSQLRRQRVGVSRFPLLSLRALHYFPRFFPSLVHQCGTHIFRPIAFTLSIISALALHFSASPPHPLSSFMRADQHKDLAKFNETEEANSGERLQ